MYIFNYRTKFTLHSKKHAKDNFYFNCIKVKINCTALVFEKMLFAKLPLRQHTVKKQGRKYLINLNQMSCMRTDFLLREKMRKYANANAQINAQI